MANKQSMILGIVLIVLGALLLLNKIGLGSLVPFIGIVLIVVGILMLLGKIGGGTVLGIVVLVLGILLQGRWIGVPGIASDVIATANLVIGIVLIVLGVLKLAGR